MSYDSGPPTKWTLITHNDTTNSATFPRARALWVSVPGDVSFESPFGTVVVPNVPSGPFTTGPCSRVNMATTATVTHAIY